MSHDNTQSPFAGVTLADLDALAPGAMKIVDAFDSGSGEIRLCLTSDSGHLTNGLGGSDHKTISGVRGTVEANGSWFIAIVDNAHIDLKGSKFEHAYEGGGLVAGSIDALDSIITSFDHI